MYYKIFDVNESFTELETDDIECKKRLIDTLSVFEEGYQYNPLFRCGIFDGKKKFYTIEPNHNIRFPKGLVEYVLKDLKNRELPYEYITNDIKHDLSIEKLETFIKKLKLPFEPYDYQVTAAHNMIVHKRGVMQSATGCLDPKSKINCEINEEDYKLLEEFRNGKHSN